MLRSWQVLVRMLDHAGTAKAEAAVNVMAIEPGGACPSAYVLVREELKRKAKSTGLKLPRIAAVSFLVRPSKEKS